MTDEQIDIDSEIMTEDELQAREQRLLEERVRAIVEQQLRASGLAPVQTPLTVPDAEPVPEYTAAEADTEPAPAPESEPEPQPEQPREVSRVVRALRSILSARILSSPEMRRLSPYLAAMGLLLVMLITSTFYIQKLYRRQQRLEAQIKELRTQAVELSAQRVQQTSRSSIVKRARRQGLDLEESVTPVKVIE